MTRGVGSAGWANAGGRLALRDKFQLVAQVMQMRTSIAIDRWGRRVGLVRDDWQRVDAREIQIPDSALAVVALAEAQRLYTPWLLNHCMRTWLWGELLARARGHVYDRELLFVAAALHDLGLTDAHNGAQAGCQCFAVEGADAARRILSAAGADATRVEKVREAITLHLNPHVSLAQGVEAHYLQTGAALDVIGAGLHTVPRAAVDEVLRRYPWLEFAEAIALAMEQQAAARPESRAAFLVRRGFLELIRQAPRPHVAAGAGGVGE